MILKEVRIGRHGISPSGVEIIVFIQRQGEDKPEQWNIKIDRDLSIEEAEWICESAWDKSTRSMELCLPFELNFASSRKSSTTRRAGDAQ